MEFVLNVMEQELCLKINFIIFASLAKIKTIWVLTISLLHNNQNNKDYAKEYFTKYDETNLKNRYDKYTLKDGLPLRGDILVFNYSKYGHVAIAWENGTPNGIYSIEQNWIPGRVGFQTHSYTKLLGYLRKKNPITKDIETLAREVIEGKYGNGIDDPNQLQIGQKIYIPKFRSMSRKGNVDAVPA